MIAVLWALVLVLLGTVAAPAQELACLTPPSGGTCVMSDTLQSTSYTRVVDYGAGTGAEFLGDQTGAKPGRLEGGVNSTVECLFGAASNTFASSLSIASDATTLNMLPNRNTSTVARYLRMVGNDSGSQASTYNFGHMNITLGAAKRMAMRWYEFVSTPYDFAFDNACTNGKLWHNNAGSYNVSPMITFESYGNAYHAYSFLPAGFGGGPTPSWAWTGHPSFEGWVGGHVPGNNGSAYALKNKWTRHEVVIRRPLASDSAASGYDYSHFVKNITDGTVEVEVARMSAGCSGCLVGGGNFIWDSGIRPVNDMKVLHIVSYRAGTCTGYKGWLYLTIVKWDTDAGQRIGAASEVEGGTASTDTGRQTLAGATAMSGLAPARVLGTIINPRPAIRSVLALLMLAVVLSSYVAVIVTAREEETRRP